MKNEVEVSVYNVYEESGGGKKRYLGFFPITEKGMADVRKGAVFERAGDPTMAKYEFDRIDSEGGKRIMVKKTNSSRKMEYRFFRDED